MRQLVFWLFLAHTYSVANAQFRLTATQTDYQLQRDSRTIAKGKNADVLLQQALDQLPNGGEITLAPGRFRLAQTVRIPANVWLRGSGRATVLRVSAPVGFLIQGVQSVVVSDLSLQADSVGQRAEVGIRLSDAGECQVHHVRVQGFAKHGIALVNNTFLSEVANCWLADNRLANLYLEKLAANSRVGDYVQNEIKNNVCVRGGHGLETNHALVVNVVGNSMFQTNGHAYYIHNESNSVLLSGNRSYQIGDDAVVVEKSDEINITGNIFCWHRGHGIRLRQVRWGSITGNNVIDTGVRARDGSSRTGILIEQGTKGIQVSSNAVFNWGDQGQMTDGIAEDNTCVKNLITSNTINFFKGEGVRSAGQGTLVTNNQAEGKNAHVAMDRPPYPDFDTKRADAFLKKLEQ